MDEYHQYAGVAQTIGVEVKFLTPEQIKEIWPLCNTEGFDRCNSASRRWIYSTSGFNTSFRQQVQEIKEQRFIETQKL